MSQNNVNKWCSAMQQLLEASVASNTFSEYIKNKGVGRDFNHLFLAMTSVRVTNLPSSMDCWAATPTATDIKPSSNPTVGGRSPLDLIAAANSKCSKKLDPWCSPSYLNNIYRKVCEKIWSSERSTKLTSNTCFFSR